MSLQDFYRAYLWKCTCENKEPDPLYILSNIVKAVSTLEGPTYGPMLEDEE